MALFSASDFRDAARGLLRAPTISVSAILCLTLGLGATTAIATAVDRALLQRLPFHDPDQLVTVYRTTPHFNTGPFSAPNYTDLSQETKSLSSMAAVSYASGLLAVNGEGSQVTVLQVTGNFFPMLGVPAQVGRLLLPDDDARTSADVAVLSDEFWRDRFGADRSIVNHTILLDGKQVTVVGILPRGFRVPRGGQVMTAQVWTPLRFSDGQLSQRNSNFLPVIGRLAPGATATGAEHELNSLFASIITAFPVFKGEGIRIVPLAADATSAVRTPILLMFGAVVMVLLIAATNVAALLLARSVHRQRETAIRAALGGSQWAVMRPALLESVLLSVIGVLGGFALAWVGVRTIGALASQRIPQLAGLSVDLKVIAGALVVAMIIAAACGALPAWRRAATDPQDALRGGRGGGISLGQQRALSGLVVAEVALSLVLMVSAGLVLKGFSRLATNDPGFDPGRILALQATVSAQSYPGELGPVTGFLEPALANIRQIPGVEGASYIQVVPFDNWGWNFNVRYEGQSKENEAQLPLVEVRYISPDFFNVTKQRLLRGRLLRESDNEQSPSVVVVNDALVKRDFKDQDPIGKRYYLTDTTYGTIVGVVSDIRNVGPYRPPAAEMYSTVHQFYSGSTAFPIMVRVRSGDPAAVAAQVRAAIRRTDPLAAVTQVRTMNEVIANSIGQPKFYLTLLGTFAIVAILLAVAGLYGVLSYAVAQRTREIGIRTALGSTALRTVQLVGRQGIGLVLVGVVIGLAGSVAATRLLTSLLYGVSPLDPVAWAGATLLLVLAGASATLVPSLRAARVDPLIAMRSE